MGTKLSTASAEMKNTPVVNVRGTKGDTFQGILMGSRAVKSGFKDEKTGEDKFQNIYEFTVEDTTMEVSVKDGKEYKPVDISDGDTVSMFAPTRLNNALRQATKGMRLKITYLGLGKAAKKGGKPHEYDVEVI
jgi:hypothetical protein